MVEKEQRNGPWFGVQSQPNWYERNKGRELSVVLQGGIVRSGIVGGVEDGDIIFKPYLGAVYSSGVELRAMVNEEDRVSISVALCKRIHPNGYFNDYIKFDNSRCLKD
jgi:hypothetical protein